MAGKNPRETLKGGAWLNPALPAVRHSIVASMLRRPAQNKPYHRGIAYYLREGKVGASSYGTFGRKWNKGEP
jgi:hypothetical protein